MITGTEEQWAVHLAQVCTCTHEVRGHVNGRGPCEHYDGCCRVEITA